MSRPRASDSARAAFLASASYAHRGLHGADGPPENSLPAFAAALDAGHGMECDVRLSADGAVFVFHDDRLDRLTEDTGPFAVRTAAEIDRIILSGGGGPIPRLAALLDRIGGQAPLLIELKVDRHQRAAPLCRAVRHDLADYGGPVAIMSFHPGVARWFHAHAPEIVRGLVITEDGRRGAWAVLKRRLAIYAAHADFLAYDIRDLPSPLVRAIRAAGRPVLSWTIRTADQWHTVAAEADAAIFEHPDGKED